MSTERSTVVGVFEERSQAEDALDELRQRGFAEDQLGFTRRQGDETENAPGTTTAATKLETGAATGLASGGAIGGLLGALAAGALPGVGPIIAGGTLLGTVLGTAAVGATAGGMLGALIGMGIPEDEARYFQQQFEVGRCLVTVQAGERYAEASAILRRCGAYDTSASSVAAGASYSPKV